MGAGSDQAKFDRYYDDLLVDQKRYRYRGPQWLSKAGRSLISRPDLVFILIGQEDELLRRKNEISREALRHQQLKYRELARKFHNAALVDASLPTKDIKRLVTDLILDYLNSRYLIRHSQASNTNLKTLDWLNSILAEKQAQARFIITDKKERGSRTERKNGESFKWVTLIDGRSYLFSEKCRYACENSMKLYNPQNLRGRIFKKLIYLETKWNIQVVGIKKVHFNIEPFITEKGLGDILLLDYLRDILGRQDLVFAISCGTPGPHRKPVISIMDLEGRIVAYAKIGWNESTISLVENEANILQEFGKTQNFHKLKFPLVIAYKHWRGRRILMTRPNSIGGHQPRRIDPVVLESLIELGRVNLIKQLFSQSDFVQNIYNRLTRLEPISPLTSCDLGQLYKNLDLLIARLSGVNLSFCCKHGDFSAWNMWVHKGSVFVIDWERFERRSIAGWDLFYFLLEGTPAFWLPSLPRTFSRPEIIKYFLTFDMELKLLWPLLGTFLIDIISFYWQTNLGRTGLSRGQISWFHSRLQILDAVIKRMQ